MYDVLLNQLCDILIHTNINSISSFNSLTCLLPMLVLYIFQNKINYIQQPMLYTDVPTYNLALN